MPSTPSKPAADPTVAPGALTGQVPAVLTTSTAPLVARAVIGAYRTLRGVEPPRQESWLYPLALSSFETAAWRSMFNENAGNVTTTSATVVWYYNPKVTEVDERLRPLEKRHDGKAVLLLRFRHYTTLLGGALDMLRALDHHGALAAADKGDLPGFQAGATKYLGNFDKQGRPVPYPDLSKLIASLRATVPA